MNAVPELMFTMLPPPCARISGITACIATIGPNTLRWKISSNRVGSISSTTGPLRYSWERFRRGLPGGVQGIAGPVLQPAGRAPAPFVCRTGIAEVGPRGRSETGRVAPTGSTYRGTRAKAIAGTGSGVVTGTQTRQRPPARGKKTPQEISQIERLL